MESKNIDDLIKSVVKNDIMENPSSDFTNKVMHSIPLENKTSFAYKPLIPKSVLIAAFLLIASAIIFLFTNGYIQNSNTHYINRFIDNIHFPQLSFQIPALVSYIIASALILIVIQAIVLGKFYKKFYK